jgi:hypothetical protein
MQNNFTRRKSSNRNGTLLQFGFKPRSRAPMHSSKTLPTHAYNGSARTVLSYHLSSPDIDQDETISEDEWEDTAVDLTQSSAEDSNLNRGFQRAGARHSPYLRSSTNGSVRSAVEKHTPPSSVVKLWVLRLVATTKCTILFPSLHRTYGNRLAGTHPSTVVVRVPLVVLGQGRSWRAYTERFLGLPLGELLGTRRRVC